MPGCTRMLGLAARRLPTARRSPGSAARFSTSDAPSSYNVLVIGGGRMGAIRCANLLSSSKTTLAGFVDVNPSVGAQMAARYGCESFVSLDEALAGLGRVDGVWVATGTSRHKEIILAAAAQGLHVAVEKPVTMNVEDTAECYQACSTNNVHLHCAFQRRADPAYQAVAAEVAAGNLGAMLSIHAVFRDHPCPPMEFLLTGGDLFHDLATHDIDYILSLTGGELPVEVYARGSTVVPELKAAGVMDTATVVFTFASGLNVSMELSRNSSYGYDQRMEIFGSNGSMCAVENMPKVPFVVANAEGMHRSTLSHSFPDRFREAYELELDMFASVMAGTAVPAVTQQGAVNASIVAEAALQSALTGAPVRL